jgi:hypothetical protein
VPKKEKSEPTFFILNLESLVSAVQMTSLAEDLLKSRGIHELKLLVLDLSNEAEKKKLELQRTVGSQYREFIQSADKIIEMKQQSQSVIKNLEDFWECNHKMTQNASFIFQVGSSSNFTESSGPTTPLRHQGRFFSMIDSSTRIY